MTSRDESSTALNTKKLHLIVSTIVIAPVALAYGFFPARVATEVFHTNVDTVGAVHLFRVLMTLYLCITALWSAGIFKPGYWQAATLTNVVFMGGLASGRLISFVVDGVPSPILVVGFGLEVVLAMWGLINLKKYGKSQAI